MFWQEEVIHVSSCIMRTIEVCNPVSIPFLSCFCATYTRPALGFLWAMVHFHLAAMVTLLRI
jgi:hypothetical protein